MLNVLLHCGIGQICVVVSRWFGGIKLGAGGLARAYQNAVLLNLETLPVAQAVERISVRLGVDYAFLAAVQRLLPDFEAVIEESAYGELAGLVVSLPQDRRGEFDSALATVTRGSATLLDLARETLSACGK